MCLKTPMNGILGFANLLKNQVLQAQEYEIIEKAARNAEYH
jgi:signal transduction histidine kinase